MAGTLRRAAHVRQPRGQFRFAPTTRATSPGRACGTELRARSSTIVSTSSSVSVGGSPRNPPLPARARGASDVAAPWGHFGRASYRAPTNTPPVNNGS
jgi:hypothetical protein